MYNMGALKEFFDKNKRSILPWVEDWTSSHNHIRYESDVRKLGYWDWLWLHPSAYLLVTYSLNASTMVIFGFITWWMFVHSVVGLAIIPFIVCGSGLLALIKNIRQYEFLRNTTFYDIFLREYSLQSYLDTVGEDDENGV